MAGETVGNEGIPGLRDLTHRGVLVKYVEGAPVDERRRLRAEAYEIVLPVVFQALTRPLEIKRGHPRCAASVHGLEDDCLDRFHDDMDAVLDDLFKNARVPIMNLEGWVRRRLVMSTVDGYRRRRGARGALQRARVPGWLAARLDHDPLRVGLAADMIEFAGVEATAGAEVWPISVWAQRRALVGGDHEAARRAVVQDVVAVIAAMRTRPKWYSDFIERPLGMKRAPLHRPSHSAPEETGDSVFLPVTRGEVADSRLIELATVAVAAIAARLARGDDPRTSAVEVVTTVFGERVGAGDLDCRPGEGQSVDDRIVAGLSDQATIDRIVAVALQIVADGAD